MIRWLCGFRQWSDPEPTFIRGGDKKSHTLIGCVSIDQEIDVRIHLTIQHGTEVPWKTLQAGL
jgi:hypothetical protein